MKKLSLVLGLLLVSMITLVAQRTITGTVLDEAGEPLIGATVLVQGTSVGTVTDLDGAYSVSLPSSQGSLVFSYTGYSTQTIVLGASNVVDVTMAIDAIGLETAIVVGYGTQSNRYKVQSVSQVGEEALRNVPALGPQQLLQGQAAGVQIVNTSGVLGAPATIRIRGVGSINAGGNPLFVVDGVPLNDGDYALNQGAPAPLNPLQDINPNDIESITVLKDAAAAAIYGSRGSNGVVIITTKKGKAGANRVSFDYFTGWSEPTYVLDMMNADEFRNFMLEYNNRTFPETSFDWPEAVRQTGRLNNYTVNMSGGTDKTQYYLSGTYANQSNYAIGNEIDRYNGRLNLKHTFNDKFRFGANIGLSRLNNDRINSDNSTFAPLTSAFLQIPTISPFDANGDYVNTGFIANVLAIEELSTRFQVTDRTTANAYLAYDIIPGLTLRSDWGIDQVGTEETIRDPNIVSPGGYGYNRIISDKKWLTTNTLNYVKELGGNIALDVLAGQSFETSLLRRTAVEGRNFASDDLLNVASASTPTLTFADVSEWALASQFVRANIRLNNRYIVEGSLRRDGSSRFGADNRWGTFWAASAGWLVSEEAFLKNSNFINNLKLTASYGVSGNDRIGNFPSLGLYGSGVAFDYSGLPGIGPTQAENPNLKWEETAQFDVGISISVLDNRLSVNANYYVKNTTDLLLPFQLPEVNGLSTIDRNAGEMRNTGIDLEINTINVSRKDFEWRTSLNMGFLDNEVIALPGASTDAQGRQFIEGTASQRAIVGHSVNTFFLVRYSGVNPETGNAEWLDLDGNPVTVLSPANRVINGSAIPDFTGGLTNTFTYKNFDLSFLLNFSVGNFVALGDLRFTENPVTNFGKSRQLLDYWTESNRDAFAPSPTSPTRTQFASASTLQLLDGSFLRLRNLSLGYTIRGNKIGVRSLQSARIYVLAQNYLTLRAKEWEGRGQDPEVADAGNSNLRQGESFFTPPQAKTITVGVNVSF